MPGVRGDLRAIMKLLEKGEAYDDDDNFHHSIVVFENETHLYRAQLSTRVITTRVSSCANVDLNKLVGKAEEIPAEVFPLYDAEVFGGVQRNLSDESVYVKRPSFIYYNTAENDGTSKLMEAEARTFRLLSKTPHPNIAKYMGCVVHDDRVIALCIEKCDHNLSEAVREENLRTKLDAKLVMNSLRSAVAHLHSLGLCHNDINPRNVMFDSNDKIVLIDFDSCIPENHKLLKCGTPDWVDVDIEVSSKRHDLIALDKVSQFLDKQLAK